MSNNTQNVTLALAAFCIVLVFTIAIRSSHNESLYEAYGEICSETTVPGTQVDGMHTRVGRLSKDINNQDARASTQLGRIVTRLDSTNVRIDDLYIRRIKEYKTRYELVVRHRKLVASHNKLAARVRKLETMIDALATAKEGQTESESLTENESQDTNASPPEVKNDELSDAADTSAGEPDGSASAHPQGGRHR